MNLVELVCSDYSAVRARVGRIGTSAFPQSAVTLYRVSHALSRRGHTRSARLLTAVNQAFTGADLDPEAQIGPGFQIAQSVGVVVGRQVVAGTG